MRLYCKKYIFIFLYLLPVISQAKQIPVLNITEKTNPKIADLYQKLQGVQGKIDKIGSERTDKLSENYRAATDSEQSLANSMLGSLTTATTGIGGMQLAQGLAEQSADAVAERDMQAYLSTFQCTAGGKTYSGGTSGIELGGGNQLTGLYQQYVDLAADLKERKAALGMKAGIESEVILDKANTGLYDEVGKGIENGTYASLYRASKGDEKDAAKLSENKDTAQKRVKGGAIATGAGVLAGTLGNAIINKDESEKIKIGTEQDELIEQLNKLIDKNTTDVYEYNNQIQQHKDLVVRIGQSPQKCQPLFNDYIKTISTIQLIENDIDVVPDTEFPDISEKQNLLEKCVEKLSSAGKQESCDENTIIEKFSEENRQDIKRIGDYYHILGSANWYLTDFCGNIIFKEFDIPGLRSVEYNDGVYKFISDPVPFVLRCDGVGDLKQEVRARTPTTDYVTLIKANDDKDAKRNRRESIDGGKTFYKSVHEEVVSMFTSEEIENMPQEWKNCLESLPQQF